MAELKDEVQVEKFVHKIEKFLGISLKPGGSITLGDTVAMVFEGDGYELTVRCGPCGCEAMLRREDEPLAYCGLQCGPDRYAGVKEVALAAARALEIAFAYSGLERLREC